MGGSFGRLGVQGRERAEVQLVRRRTCRVYTRRRLLFIGGALSQGVSSNTGSSDFRELISRESPLPWMRKFAWLSLLTHHALWQHSLQPQSRLGFDRPGRCATITIAMSTTESLRKYGTSNR